MRACVRVWVLAREYVYEYVIVLYNKAFNLLLGEI